MSSTRKDEAKNQQDQLYVSIITYEKVSPTGVPGSGVILSEPTTIDIINKQHAIWSRSSEPYAANGVFQIFALYMPKDSYLTKYAPTNDKYIASEFHKENERYRESVKKSRLSFMSRIDTQSNASSEPTQDAAPKNNNIF